MAWLWLILAGLLEIVWALSMKLSDGFTRWLPTLVMVVAMIGSFALLSVSMKSLPLGTAYTVWTAIGAVGAFVVGVIVLGESMSFGRISAVTLIVAGVVLLKFAS
jgi:quaternary ammonium compound-resistance protein SugE